jgi:hypothetical protein
MTALKWSYYPLSSSLCVEVVSLAVRFAGRGAVLKGRRWRAVYHLLRFNASHDGV